MDHEFVVGDPACVAHQIGQGQRELLVVDVFDLTAAGGGRCAHGGEGCTGEGEEFAVMEHAGDPDSSVDIFANAGSDAADIPCAAEPLLKDSNVNGCFPHDDDPDSCRITGRKVPFKEIEDVLIARTDYLDEGKWCQGLALTLRLPRIELKMIDNKFVPLRISLLGVTEPLTDPRVVEAAMQAMKFRRVGAIGIEAGGCIAVLRPGHMAWAKIGSGSSAATLSSGVIITAERLAAVESQGGALSELLGLQSEVA
jgi:hypothetical protein